MRIFLLVFVYCITVLSSMAQPINEGYFRVRNYMSKRYVYVTDDKGKLDYQASTADMYAIQLWMGFDKACSDPATVCYIKHVEGSRYDIQSQGTGIYKIISSYVNVIKNNDGTYYAYGTKDGFTKYLSDGEKELSLEKGVMSDAGKGEWRKWNILPFSDENYFGIKPTINAGGKHYVSFYTAFPYSFKSSGMNAYYINKVENGYAVMKEITGVIPAYTPVYVSTSSSNPSDNRLNIGGNATPVKGNLMKGVFFDNPMKSHYNRVAYDPQTMRVLGVMKDGSIGFVTSDIKFIPANTSYIKVNAGSPSEFKIVTEQEYNELVKKKPEKISLDKTALTLTEGEKTTLKATVYPSDAYDKSVTWTSDNTGIARVENGVVTAVKAGNVKITAATYNGLKAFCDVTVKKPIVKAQSVKLNAESYEGEEGTQYKLTAYVLPLETTDKSVKWSSSNNDIATVNNGLVELLKEGSSVITATTLDGTNLSASCNIKVNKKKILVNSISLNKKSIEGEEGTEFKLIAFIEPGNATNKTLKWESSDIKTATVDAGGNVKLIKKGSAYITVSTTDGSNLSIKCLVTVKEKTYFVQSIELDKTSYNGVEGEIFHLFATVLPHNAANKKIKWSSDDERIAKVDENGRVTLVKAGATVITAEAADGSGIKAQCKVNVSPRKVLANGISLDKKEYNTAVGEKFTLVATISPKDVTNGIVKWESSQKDVATVNSNGEVETLKEGFTLITAATTDGTDIKDVCMLTVKNPVVKAQSITLDKKSYEGNEGEEFTINAQIMPEDVTIKSVKWKSSASDIAMVDNNGLVKLLKQGNAKITAATTDGTNLSVSCFVTVKKNIIPVDSITLDKDNHEGIEGEHFFLNVTLYPGNATNKEVKWETSDKNVASVDNTGRVNLIKDGKATITVRTTDMTNLSASCNVTVKKAEVLAKSISLDKEIYQAVEGSSFTLTATVLPEETTDKNVKWQSSDNDIASVDSKGTVILIKEGKATITASTTDGSDLSASCDVTVKKDVVLATTIYLDKEIYEAEIGSTFTLTATILPEDATIKKVAWASSDEDIATVNEGVVNVIGEGVAQITASTTDGTDLTFTCIVNGTSAIEEVFRDIDSFPVSVYTLSGRCIMRAENPGDFKKLMQGVYIVNNRKIVVTKR